MKLSELKGERAVEVLADLIAPITNIARDADNLQLFRNKLQDGETARDAGIRLFKERIPVLIKIVLKICLYFSQNRVSVL